MTGATIPARPAGNAGRFDRVLVNHEALIFAGGRILPESFVEMSQTARRYEHVGRYGWFLLKNHWLRRGEVDVASGLWAIDNWSPDSYYHWTVGVLPRLLHAEAMHPDQHVLLLPRYYQRQPYMAFMLRAFPHIKRVHWIEARTKTRVARLDWVPRQPPERRPDQFAEIARRVGAIAGTPGGARRIYFSREDATRRRARNEAELVKVLRSHDVEIIHIDPSRPWEQVQASLGASLIIGVHGAALTNLIYMARGGRLLEFRHGHDDLFRFSYRYMASDMGIEHHSQICELAQGASGWEINDADLTIDLDLLREKLRALDACAQDERVHILTP